MLVRENGVAAAKQQDMEFQHNSTKNSHHRGWFETHFEGDASILLMIHYLKARWFTHDQRLGCELGVHVALDGREILHQLVTSGNSHWNTV